MNALVSDIGNTPKVNGADSSTTKLLVSSLPGYRLRQVGEQTSEEIEGEARRGFACYTPVPDQVRPRVLVGCEFSGRVRDAMESVGCDAWSCDIEPSAGKHLQCDVREVLEEKWDMIIAHPPCTYLSYAATKYWNEPGRAKKRAEAFGLFLTCYYAPCERVAIENPVGLPNTLFRKPDQLIHPYYFGDRHNKRTALWLRGLKPLKWAGSDTLFERQTSTAKPEAIYIDRASGKKRYFTDAISGTNRGGERRSVTFDGIASAMAEQWGKALVAAMSNGHGV